MTEMEPYRRHLEDIDSWVEVLAPVGDLATRIAGTAFVPDALRGSPAAVAAAILTGRELGIGPLTALRHVNVIKGRPGQSAELMRALILREGHSLRYLETTDTRCVVEGRRRGDEEWTRVTFTADQARKAKPPIDLSGYPEDKLVARATSRLARRVFADVVAGMPYTTDELEDVPTDSGGAAPAPIEEAQPRRTAQRAPRQRKPAAAREAAPADTDVEQPTGPPLPGEAGYDEPAAPPAPEPITKAQLQMLHASFTEVGVKDRDERLATASGVIGRDITSSNDLTKDEASSLISALALRAAAEADDAEEPAELLEVTE